MAFFIISLTILAAYLFPALVAHWRNHRNENPIFIINLFLGWTAIGWILALLWSLTDNVKPKVAG